MNGCDAHGVFLGEIRNNRRNGIDVMRCHGNRV